MNQRNRKGLTLVELMVLVAIFGVLFVIVASAFGGGCANRPGPEKAIQVVESLGMTDAHVTDTITWTVAASGCGDDDGIAFKVAAKNNREEPVNITVCCGVGFYAKGCTPRF